MSDYSALRRPLSERLPIVMYANRFCPVAETVWMSPQVERLTGYRLDEWVGNAGFFETVLHPDDRAPVLQEVRDSRDELRAFSRDYRLVARDGRIVWIHDESVPIVDDEGRPEFIQGYFIDISDRKALEQQLLHAQRIDALGRLAGGIAHDFNNHLTAIRGYAELIARALPHEDPVVAKLREIIRTTDRASRLTKQLLAFSRRREVEPRDLYLDEVVRDFESMMRPVAGDAVRLVMELERTPT